MTREEKDLLLKDLCARLPYGVKIQYEDDIFTIDYISGMYEEINLNTPDRYTIDILEIKPYLFPLSSMTLEQECQYREVIASSPNYYEVYDWLNKNHFDYRDLIEKGLAIDCTNLDIY